MFPVRIILMYWSAVVRLRNSPEQTVDATTLTLPFMKRTKTEVILPSIPLAVMAPPETHGAKNQPDCIHHASHATCRHKVGQHIVAGIQTGASRRMSSLPL